MTRISEMLTVREAAEVSGRHPETIRRWIKDGDLDAMKVRGRSGYEYRMREDDLLECLKSEEHE